ncbi:thioredoxin-like protein [Paraphysoderma sedebokerense]|nr:thioredoxin-like protein [Paraphysoderma sedebokerense]
MAAKVQNFYALKSNLANHEPFEFSSLKGKVVVVVNVASKCGFTPQYSGLENLYKKYKGQGLEILGFPCNQFGGQEPGKEEEIVSFCSLNYGVSFPVMEKVDVNGDSTHPVYDYLKSQKKQLMMARIKWNFEKFLIDRNGQVVERFASTASPESMEKKIVELLQKPNVEE